MKNSLFLLRTSFNPSYLNNLNKKGKNLKEVQELHYKDKTLKAEHYSQIIV